MKMFASVVLLGCSLVSGFALAKADVKDLREVPIGEMRIWDCDGRGYQFDEEFARRVHYRMAAMSSIHWSIGCIMASYMGDDLRGGAAFSVGVFEDSQVPEIKVILQIARSAAQCGELVVGPYHYPL
jgi:hypothetical protein